MLNKENLEFGEIMSHIAKEHGMVAEGEFRLSPREGLVQMVDGEWKPKENGRLLVRYNGTEYHFGRSTEHGGYEFCDIDGEVNDELTKAYREAQIEEEEQNPDYGVDSSASPVLIARRAVEALGAEMVKFEDMVWPSRDIDGNLITY